MLDARAPDLWATVRAAARGERSAIEAGLGSVPGDLRETSVEVLALLDEPAPSSRARSAAVQGALAALLLGRLRDRLVPLWLQLGGPAGPGRAR